MDHDPPGAGRWHIRTLFAAGTATGMSDAQLLGRFAEAAGAAAIAEAAFAALMARHGPMVLGVCRRALEDPRVVEDAFQATFLVLVQKAGTVRVGDSLGRWLYGVARRVSTRARANAQRRRAREGSIVIVEPPTLAPDPASDELHSVLDEEMMLRRCGNTPSGECGRAHGTGKSLNSKATSVVSPITPW
jgi:HlyD family secretion protein